MTSRASDAEIREILEGARVIAVVGASDRPDRDSHVVMARLLERGYRVIPVNPNLAGKSVLGQRAVARLEDIAEGIDIVDIFRRPVDVPPVVASAIAVKAKAIWMQLGIVHEEAAAAARAAGLKVVMDRCIKIEVLRLDLHAG